MVDRSLRAEILGPSGVGAIIDILGESFVAEDTSRWQGKWHILKAPRITSYFDTANLRTPPPAERDTPGLPYLRFPQWLCGQCRQMIRWSSRKEKQGEPASWDARNTGLSAAHVVRCCMRKRSPWRRTMGSLGSFAFQQPQPAPVCGSRHSNSFTFPMSACNPFVCLCDTCQAGRVRELPAPGALKGIGLKCLAWLAGGSPRKAEA